MPVCEFPSASANAVFLFQVVSLFFFRRQLWVGKVFLQAEVTARYVSLQKGDPLPEPWEYYPTLFEEEKQAFEQEKLREYYEKRREDAARYNQRRHQTEES